MSDIFAKQQAAIDAVKHAAANFNAFGEPKQKCACDDIATWQGALSCAECQNPCVDPETKLSGVGGD